MYRKSFRIFPLALSFIFLTSCLPWQKYNRYESTFMDVFDTYSVIVGYARTGEEFHRHADAIHERLKDLHQKYDVYNSYDGINNLRTINDKAGVEPVAVHQDIIDLLKFGRQAYHDTGGSVNIAMGPVLRLWHDYREAGKDDPENAKLPPMEELEAANFLTGIDGLIIDEAAGTAYLAEKGMSLDVGAIAKGYAVQLAASEAEEAGLNSALINIGGNICAVGKPLDGKRDRWSIGIQDPKPDENGAQNILDTVLINDASVVTSGNYQRFYIVDGKPYNHIIDRDTLMPAERYASVTVVCAGSGMADALSTCLFILPVEDGKAVLNALGGEAVWVLPDGSLEATEGYKRISKELGGHDAEN